MNRFTFLSSFHPINENELTALEKNMRTETFTKGTHLVVPGQVQKYLYFVKSGIQAVSFEREGKPFVIAFTYPPNLCALPESFSEQKPSKYSFSAITNSEVDCLSFDQLQSLFIEFPNIERLFRRINERLVSGILNIHTEFRSLSIEERFVTFCRRSPHLLREVPHKYIASYLGIDATNFSKLYNRVKI
jgi:CRP-like cAMP-binding protein